MRRRALALALLATSLAAGVTAAEPKRAGVSGYGAKVDAVAVTGPPPAPGSPADAADRAAAARSAARIGSPAWQEGTAQLALRSKPSLRIMGCALGWLVSPQATPATWKLLARSQAELNGTVAKAKKRFRRDRPFVGDPNQQTCDPRSRDAVKPGSGDVLGYSYPSGHAAHGRLMAQVLTQVAPARAGALRAWGEAVGDNRVACRLHWPSDVAAGRRLADAVYAQIKDKPALRSDVAAARAEMDKAPLAIAC